MPDNNAGAAIAGQNAKAAATNLIDIKFFYQRLRDLKLFDKMTTLQVETVDALINEWHKTGETDLRRLSYVMATAYHEAYNPRVPESRLTPIVEFGGLTYLKKKPYYPHIGYGLVQLTWKANYEKAGKLIGVDLVTNPALALNVINAAKIAVLGMLKGIFTGKKLSDYFNDKKEDPVQARRIINSLDRAELIAGYYKKFLQCLRHLTQQQLGEKLVGNT